MDLYDKEENVRTREDLAQFVRDLRRDLASKVEEWENPSLDQYLDSLSAVIDSLDQRFKNNGEEMPEHPSWQLIADILHTAKIYE